MASHHAPAEHSKQVEEHSATDSSQPLCASHAGGRPPHTGSRCEAVTCAFRKAVELSPYDAARAHRRATKLELSTSE